MDCSISMSEVQMLSCKSICSYKSKLGLLNWRGDIIEYLELILRNALDRGNNKFEGDRLQNLLCISS